MASNRIISWSARLIWALLIVSITAFAAETRDVTNVRMGSKSPEASDKRIALVIGNTRYPGDAKLKNPGNDATDLSAALTKLGFKLVPEGRPVLDASRDQLNKAIWDFQAELQRNPGAVGLFYFSGHGVELDGQNYLLPVGTEFDIPDKVEVDAVSAQHLLKQMQKGNARVSLVILDACRNNPWQKNWYPGQKGDHKGGGLAPMQAPSGFMIAFAAQPGRTASDNPKERNGLFTKMLIDEIQKPGQHIYDVFNNVRQRVDTASNGHQLPEEKNVLTGTLYLAGEPVGSRLPREQLLFLEQLGRLQIGDSAAKAELVKSPVFLTMSKLIDENRLRGDELAKDRQTIAMAEAQSRSADPDERQLGLAMLAYSEGINTGAGSLRSLAESGNAYAAMMLERVYRNGLLGYAKNDELAARWRPLGQSVAPQLERLAKKDNPIALSWQGNQYRDQKDAKEQAKAIGKFKRAADLGYGYAMGVLGSMYLNGQGVTKDETEGVKWYRKSADVGFAHGMANLGAMYELGRGGLTKNEAEAVKWYRKASDLGHTRAMAILGLMYENGRGGLAKDEAEAVKWYRKAADAGIGTGMTYLGLMYENGRGGLAKDEAEAVKWYRKAADSGNAWSMDKLGYFYLNGIGGLLKDDAEAMKWYRKAADAQNSAGMANYGFMFEFGRGGLAKDEAEAAKWYRKAADAGNAWGMNRLGDFYDKGLGSLTKDDAEAVKWYRKAADAGSNTGMLNLGLMYENGRGGLAKDEAEAVKWYRKAAEAGDGTGMVNLGVKYEHGRGGLAKDEAEAVKWYRKAADAQNSAGIANYGFMYEFGRGGLSKDAAEAAKWYRKAADAGDTWSMNRLGYFYREGLGGLNKDDDQAAEWYRKAADKGHASSMTELGWMYEKGRGVEKSGTEAAKWYRKGAEAGNDEGMWRHGWILLYGNGTAKDENGAVSWYRKSAESGNAYGMYLYGQMHEQGLGGLYEDRTEAIRWYKKSAELGQDAAKKRLSELGQ